jgi:hypothetical protein
MYLIVRGYCRAVYSSTLTKMDNYSALPRFCNSKDLYGELGVIQKDMNAVGADYVVKNIAKALRPVLYKMKPGYLPKVKK